MSDTIFGICIGLIVGWNLLPQPAVVKRAYDWAYRKLQGLAAKLPEDDGEEV